MFTAAQQYIEARVERITESGCWIWTKALKGKGYGACFFNRAYWYSHHLAWEAYRGPRNGLHVLHHCDVMTCCNPEHLFLGTNNDNIQDRVRKGRSLRGETHNLAKLTEQQVREIRQTTPRIDSETSIAKRYGISRSMVGYIRRGKNWTHIL